MKEEWKFKQPREQLIAMVQKYIDKKWANHMAMDITDAIFLETADYMEKEYIKPLKKERENIIKEAKKIMEPEYVDSEKMMDYIRKMSEMKRLRYV